jgi:hypothetical protein
MWRVPDSFAIILLKGIEGENETQKKYTILEVDEVLLRKETSW